VSDCLSFFFVPSRSFSMPLYPQSVTSQGACPNSLFFRCFHFRLTFESIKEFESTLKMMNESRISGVIVVPTSSLIVWGS